MRCLNCGNENPPDNIYCNECGARLQDMANAEVSVDTNAASGADPSMGAGITADPGVGVSAQVSEPHTHSAGQDVQMYAPQGSSTTQEHEQPDDHITFAPVISIAGDGLNTGDTGSASVGAHYVEEPDQAMPGAGSQDVFGAEDAQGAVAAASGGHSTQDADSTYGAQDTHSSSASGSMNTSGGMESALAPASTGDEQEVPVTEDTMAAPSHDAAPSYSSTSQQDQAGSAVMGASVNSEAAGVSMPDVIPIVEAEEHAPIVASYDEISPAASGTPSTPNLAQAAPSAASDSNSEWATQALHQLEEAQQAMAKGDWSGFGQSLGDLRSFLEGIIYGPTSSMSSAGGASGAASSPLISASSAGSYQSQEATGAKSTSMSGGESGPSAVSSPTPTLEPAAEAGSLGAIAMGSNMGAAVQSGYVPAVSADGQPGMARLVVISTGAELPLPEQEEITVGREDPSSGIFPDVDLTPYGGEEGGVSRRHARLLRIGDDYYVEDLQSTNYTKLDGQRLPAHVRERIEDSARLDFGRIAVIFRRS